MSTWVNRTRYWVGRNCGRKIGYWVRSVFFVDRSNSINLIDNWQFCSYEIGCNTCTVSVKHSMLFRIGCIFGTTMSESSRIRWMWLLAPLLLLESCTLQPHHHSVVYLARLSFRTVLPIFLCWFCNKHLILRTRDRLVNLEETAQRLRSHDFLISSDNFWNICCWLELNHKSEFLCSRRVFSNSLFKRTMLCCFCFVGGTTFGG